MKKQISNKAKANLKILRMAIARGDSVYQTFKKLNLLSKINNDLRRNKKTILLCLNKFLKKIEKENIIFKSTHFLYK